MAQNDWDSSGDDSIQTDDQNEITEANQSTAGSAGAQGSATDDTVAGSEVNLEHLKKELEETKDKLNELTTISKQALADLQNFKKRTEEEKVEFIHFANSNLIGKLLPTIDHLHLALGHLPEEKSAQEWAKGVVAIFKQLEDVLKEFGLEEIKAHEEEFNPEMHEALTTGQGPKDQILNIVGKGYKIGGRILRKSQVIVGHGEEEKPSDQNNENDEK